VALFLVKACSNRPDFRQVVAFLGFTSFDSDGDSHNPGSRTWTWLYLKDREEPGELVEVYAQSKAPLILAVESTQENLAAAVAYYLASFMHSTVCVGEQGDFTAPNFLLPLLNGFELPAALTRAETCAAARATPEIPFPEFLETTDERALFLGRLSNAESRFFNPRPLEEYLRALWSEIIRHRNETPSYALFATMMENAFTVAPAHFAEEWRKHTTPAAMESESFEDLQQTLLFQIADLHAMTENGQIKILAAWRGVKSPSGNLWYDFQTGLFLIHGVQAFGERPQRGCCWGMLGEFLESARHAEL